MATALTSNAVLKELNLSRSTFYYLLKNNLISVQTTESGRYVWDKETIESLKALLAEKTEIEPVIETPKAKTTKINNRRYLGNKYKLLDFIKGTVEKECKGITTVADIFAGTGSVASAFSDKKLITNDLLYFNHICHVAWFGSEKYDEEKALGYLTVRDISFCLIKIQASSIRGLNLSFRCDRIYRNEISEMIK